MKGKILYLALLLLIIACANNRHDKLSVVKECSSSNTTEPGKSLLHDTLKQYISDACRTDTRILLDVVNTLFTTQKYDHIPENQKYLEKIIREDGKTIYRFNYQNSMKMLVVKEGNETTSISATTDIYDAFVMMSLAIIEMSSDSVQIVFNNNNVYTGYLYKEIVAVPCETENFHQILFYETE